MGRRTLLARPALPLRHRAPHHPRHLEALRPQALPGAGAPHQGPMAGRRPAHAAGRCAGCRRGGGRQGQGGVRRLLAGRVLPGLRRRRVLRHHGVRRGRLFLPVVLRHRREAQPCSGAGTRAPSTGALAAVPDRRLRRRRRRLGRHVERHHAEDALGRCRGPSASASAGGGSPSRAAIAAAAAAEGAGPVGGRGGDEPAVRRLHQEEPQLLRPAIGGPPIRSSLTAAAVRYVYRHMHLWFFILVCRRRRDRRSGGRRGQSSRHDMLRLRRFWMDCWMEVLWE